MANAINANNIVTYLNKVVKIADLSSIYDLWMILIRPRNSNLSDDEGILSFVGKEPTEESYLLYNVCLDASIGKVISTWDMYIGTVNTGKTLLLACPKNRLNFEYYNELEKFFGLKPTVAYLNRTTWE